MQSGSPYVAEFKAGQNFGEAQLLSRRPDASGTREGYAGRPVVCGSSRNGKSNTIFSTTRRPASSLRTGSIGQRLFISGQGHWLVASAPILLSLWDWDQLNSPSGSKAPSKVRGP